MIRTLDASMLNLPHSLRELAPLCRQYGIQAISATGEILDNEKAAAEAAAVMQENGLLWGLMPMPADFYHWELDDEQFEQALKVLERRAVIAEKLGVKHAYNHVWSSSPRPFDENFEWHIRRVAAVSDILSAHGVQYGLEFLGPHELRGWQPYEFVHSLSGVLAIADAAGGKAGIAFDTFHWYTSGNGCMDDVLLMQQHPERLVALHINDAVAGVTYDKQQDMQRRLPMETGVIDSRDILRRFEATGSNALYMIEPFEPSRTLFNKMTADEAVRTAAEIFARL